MQLYKRMSLWCQEVAEEYKLWWTMGGHLVHLPAQSRSFDGHEFLSVLINDPCHSWLAFSLLDSPLLYAADTHM